MIEPLYMLAEKDSVQTKLFTATVLPSYAITYISAAVIPSISKLPYTRLLLLELFSHTPLLSALESMTVKFLPLATLALTPMSLLPARSIVTSAEDTSIILPNNSSTSLRTVSLPPFCPKSSMALSVVNI